MINYRSLKKLLGETSLERKCRLLLGGALMVLIFISFSVYAGRTQQLVENQQVVRAEALVGGILHRYHLQQFATDINDQSASVSQDRAQSADWAEYVSQLAAVDQFKVGGTWSVIGVKERPANEQDFEALQRLQAGEESFQVFGDDESGEPYVKHFKSLKPAADCLRCHDGSRASLFQDEKCVGMATIQLSMDAVQGELSRNRAILIAAGIITSFLAMLVAYVIVRYIIVKPVLHLKDVSEQIYLGNYQPANINTGDEFEKLSHAFNKMVRELTRANEDLNQANGQLDRKVDQLAATALELRNTNAMKDEFLATMSHELRTPLNSINGFSDILAKSVNLDDKQRRWVENIRKSGHNLMVQINDLLDLAKIESGNMRIEASDVDVLDLTELQVSQIRPLADQKNIDLKIRNLLEARPDIEQDAGKLRQILNNLLSNAIKFTPEGGRVRVTIDLVEDDRFSISVEDTGIGIPMPEQDLIFDKFRQGTTTATGERDQIKREYGGTGLGLSIVRELSSLLGGEVLLESEFGKGSMFTVTLPKIAPGDDPHVDLNIDSPSSHGNRITSVDLTPQQKQLPDETQNNGDDTPLEDESFDGKQSPAEAGDQGSVED